MHFLGLAGMPRRIPGTQVDIFNLIVKQFAKIDKTRNILRYSQNYKLLILESNIRKKSKCELCKHNTIGQYTKTRYDLLYARSFASTMSGSCKGNVNMRSNILCASKWVSNCGKADKPYGSVEDSGVFSKNFQKNLHPLFVNNRLSTRTTNKRGLLVIRRNLTTSLNIIRNTPQKNCGESLDTPQAWHRKLVSFDKRVDAHWLRIPKGSEEEILHNPEYQIEVDTLVTAYNLIVSKLVKEELNTTQIFRIVASNLPRTIEQMQCWFIESACARYYAVRKIKLSPGSRSSGVDGKKFLSVSQELIKFKLEKLKNSRYSMSGKSTRVKKNLPSKANITPAMELKIQEYVARTNLELEVQLEHQTRIRNLCRNYKEGKIKRI
jgi:hypothetical protein